MNLYKFRACNDNFFKELEGQYIYFSKLDKLNDPMEGIKDMYWKGDGILWKNFLKHYFFCLYDIIKEELYNNLEEDCLSKLNDNLKVFDVTKYLSIQDNNCELLSKVNTLFLEHQGIIMCIELLSEQEINKDRLYDILLTIGNFAIATIKQINNHDFQSYNNPFTTSPENAIKLHKDYCLVREKYFYIEEVNKESRLQEAIKILADNKKSSDTPTTVDLFTELSINFSHNHSFLQKRYIPAKIALDYRNMLKNIKYNKISISCFSKENNSPLMWSHYANNHQGVCLIFDDQLLRDPLHEEFSYHKVDYNNEPYKVNFFDSLFSILVDKNNHCINKEYKGSSKYTEFLNKRESHENEYYSNIGRKLEQWSYENEFRIVHHARNSNEIKEFLYSSPALLGIIFGMKICPKNREKILRILLEKYIDNDNPKDINFRFYQTYYSQEFNEIKIFDCQEIMELSMKSITRIISQ